MDEYIKRGYAVDAVLDVYCDTPDIDLSCEKFEAAILKIQAATKYAWASPDNTGHRVTVDADDVNFGVDKIPSADVATVRHGRWERIGIKGRKALPIYPCCSACGMVSAAFRSEWEGLRGAWKYCPNCGAKMDLEG